MKDSVPCLWGRIGHRQPKCFDACLHLSFGSWRKSPLSLSRPANRILSSAKEALCFLPPSLPPSVVRLSEPSRSPFVFALTPILPSLPAPSAPPATLTHFLRRRSRRRLARAAASHRATQSCSCGGVGGDGGRNSGGSAEVYALCLIFHLFLSKGGALPLGRGPRQAPLLTRWESPIYLTSVLHNPRTELEFAPIRSSTETVLFVPCTL